MRLNSIILISLIFLLSSCAQGKSIFPDLGDELATPSAMALDTVAGRLYVVNSNANVFYNWQQGSFQVYDITDPLSPVLMLTVPTASFSGQIYLDPSAGLAYVPNRYSPDERDLQDRLYVFDVDEASPDFGTFTEYAAGRDAYAIDCCWPAGRFWISTSLGELQYYDMDAMGPPGIIDLKSPLDTGGTLTDAEFSHIARTGEQAFLTREYGGVMIVNLDKAGVEGVTALDYWIDDVPNPRGIAADGTELWVVGEGSECDGWCRYVMLLDVSSLTPLTGNTTTRRVKKQDAGLVSAVIEVGRNPQEILLTEDYAFVTNQDDNTVSVIDRAARAVVATIDAGREPFSLALYETPAEGEKYVFVGNVESNTISIIDIAGLTIVATYP